MTRTIHMMQHTKVILTQGKLSTLNNESFLSCFFFLYFFICFYFFQESRITYSTLCVFLLEHVCQLWGSLFFIFLVKQFITNTLKIIPLQVSFSFFYEEFPFSKKGLDFSLKKGLNKI